MTTTHGLFRRADDLAGIDEPFADGGRHPAPAGELVPPAREPERSIS